MSNRVKAVLRVNESKLDKYIRNGLKTSLRLLWLRSEFRNHALNRNRIPIDSNIKRQMMLSGRYKNVKGQYVYPCELCDKPFKSNEVEIDHKEGVRSLFYLSDLPKYMESLFCHPDMLQRVCVACHRAVTHGSNDL